MEFMTNYCYHRCREKEKAEPGLVMQLDWNLKTLRSKHTKKKIPGKRPRGRPPKRWMDQTDDASSDDDAFKPRQGSHEKLIYR